MTARLRPVLLAAGAAVLLSAAPAGAAAAKRCGTFAGPVGKAKYSAKNVSCKAARKVLTQDAMGLCFDNQVPGWKKEWRPTSSGGRTLTLRKGAKVIKTNACG